MGKSITTSNRPIPILYERKEECCGCTACCAGCIREAISMLPDLEGFLYPHINEDLCVRCYQCMKVCPIKEAKKKTLRSPAPSARVPDPMNNMNRICTKCEHGDK